jgi:hypothetical protein
MRILNDDKGKQEAVNNVILMLTLDEAKELKGDIEQLISRNSLDVHYHTNDQEYEHEITVGLYEPSGKITQFTPRIQKLILENK